jgi:hypothetical protein
MLQLAPHLLLRADTGASHSATLLRGAGYIVSKINHDTLAERITGAPEIDGVVVELPALAAIAAVRRIEAYRRNAVIVVVTPEVDAVRRALPSAKVIRPGEVDDDLVSTVDLALVAQQMRLAG